MTGVAHRRQGKNDCMSGGVLKKSVIVTFLAIVTGNKNSQSRLITMPMISLFAFCNNRIVARLHEVVDALCGFAQSRGLHSFQAVVGHLFNKDVVGYLIMIFGQKRLKIEIIRILPLC